MRTGAVILAAGEGMRFGGHKLLAALDGRPILQFVLDAVAAADVALTVVVLGADAADVERAVTWRNEHRVVNPDPSRGLSSSLKLGLAAIEALPGAETLDAVLVALGDQPRTSSAVIRTLLDAETDRPIVVPRFRDDGARNPVVLHRHAWPLVAKASGDRGLGAFIEAHRDLVLELPMAGANPDVDTPADLAALAEDAESGPGSTRAGG